MGIPQQFLASGTQLLVAFLFPAVKADHPFYCLFFLLDTGRHVYCLDCQRFKVGKNSFIPAMASSLVKFIPESLLNSSVNCAQCSIISSIVQSCAKSPC
ncbi:hypothetical protein BACUNI_01291 [Bacteroides uniformis ATCC 8492]|uniref:Secreted protein n=1 Tax=Bacteroides uniformis (strain ATCC 8492 / DSM 6597 / CCUG 4942 / CIP 103695 / JCM 5828 / KCTC 5204 / NCTC 13054 / VPI 0061) TaxID=411479 RepID=A0ABC9NEQ0_BACUC|nr:hypothetical protein BACUNI_01291 [Bacteroides uniformis ATCC 8492]